jgi:hypothetical protein
LETDDSESTPQTSDDEVRADVEELLSESGEEDVPSELKQEELKLNELNELAGRKGDNAFKTLDDFKKHYGNLKSFVGKKQEKPVVPPTETEGFVSRDEYEADKFFSLNPNAKPYEKIVKSMAKDEKISLGKAWEEFEPIAEAHQSKEKEAEVVKTKNRTSPAAARRMEKLEESAKTGDDKAQQEYLREAMGIK